MKKPIFFALMVIATFFILFKSIHDLADQEQYSLELDQQFRQAMTKAAKDKSLFYWLLPDSQDFLNIPQDPANPINKPKVELGRRLLNNKFTGIRPMKNAGYGLYSCANSCHNLEFGGSSITPFSIGDGGRQIGDIIEQIPAYPDSLCDIPPIKSPANINQAFQENTLWSSMLGAGGANEGINFNETGNEIQHPSEWNALGYKGLETQAIVGAEGHRLEFNPLVNLYKNDTLIQLFHHAYPTDQNPLTDLNAKMAIAAYQRTIITNEAPLQMYLKGEKSALNNEMKEAGLLFFANCTDCHSSPSLANDQAFFDFEFEDMWDCYPDKVEYNEGANAGRFVVTKDSSDYGKYKVPGLYNVVDHRCWGHGCCYDELNTVVTDHNAKLSDEVIEKCIQFLEALRDPNLQRFEEKNSTI